MALYAKTHGSQVTRCTKHSACNLSRISGVIWSRHVPPCNKLAVAFTTTWSLSIWRYVTQPEHQYCSNSAVTSWRITSMSCWRQRKRSSAGSNGADKNNCWQFDQHMSLMWVHYLAEHLEDKRRWQVPQKRYHWQRCYMINMVQLSSSRATHESILAIFIDF